MKQWPFAHTIEMTHRLQDGVLQMQTTLHNMSAEPMPAQIGFHPYYRLDDSPRDQWTVTVPAKTHWLLANTKVATGETESGEQFFPNGQRSSSRTTTSTMCSATSRGMRRGARTCC